MSMPAHMRPSGPHRHAGLTIWLTTCALAIGVLGVGAVGPLAQWRFGTPHLLFYVMVTAAAGCWAGGATMILVGIRSRISELTILGTALTVGSGFGFVHGLTAPGVLFPANNAVETSALLSLPAFVAAGFPLLAPASRPSRWLARHAVPYAGCWVGVGSALAAFMLAAPDALPAPSVGSPATVLLAATGVAGGLALSWRQLALYQISRRPACLAASVSLVMLAVTGLIWFAGGAFGVAWWVAHLFDVVGVLGATAAVLAGYRAGVTTMQILEPVVAFDPLASLELGLSPLVHRFVADLDRKDQITRDHVVRVGELAVRAGTALGLPAPRLRTLGVAALLHDVGKLEIPLQIIAKPGRLDEHETAVIRTHTTIGFELLSAEPGLAHAAVLVRAHHERPDGGGYPDGLTGDRIPLEAAIISVCDAYDAMAHTRQYREGMGPERAIAVLREHAGTQWLPQAVEAVISVLPALAERPHFDDVGRSARRVIPEPRPAPDDICSDALTHGH